MERERSLRLTVVLDETKQELKEFRTEQEVEKPRASLFGKVAGWVGAKLTGGRVTPVQPDRPADIEVRIGNCLDLIEPDGKRL